MLWENPKDAIITLMILLMVIGCVNVFSASFVKAEAMTGNPYHFLVRYLIYAAVGGVVFWVTAFHLNYKRMMSPRFYKVVVGVTILLLAATLGVGTVVNGSRRWIYIAGFSLQASELAKVSKKKILSLGGLGVLICALAMLAPYRRARIFLWLDPWKDAQGGGYQMTQSLMAIGSGGLTGLPWGQGSSKFFYLPEAHTDFAFAIFCQEWGYIGALFLIACFVIMAWAMVTIAMNTKDRRGYMLVAGATLFLIGQAAANMAMVTGLLPVIGVPLMFISYGGTSLIANMFTLGLIISVYRNESARETMEERIAAGLPPTEDSRLRVVSANRNRRPF